MFVAMRNRLEEREEGFTLIELLVVVIIIGILAAIAIPTFLNQRQRGWQAELTSTARNTALEIEAEATALNGDYSQVVTTDAEVQAFADAIQGAAADPVTVTFGNSSGTSFCFTATHADLGTSNIAYDSAAGGLSDFSEAGAASC